MRDAGRRVPLLDSRPDIMGFEWLWEAFVALNSCRAAGMTVGEIPWTAVQRYAEVARMDEEETWMLHGVIRHMDMVFLKHHSEQHKAHGPSPHARHS